jgi:hypothetical protein
MLTYQLIIQALRFLPFLALLILAHYSECFLPFLALLILAHVSGRALLALSRLANFGTVRGGELRALHRLKREGREAEWTRLPSPPPARKVAPAPPPASMAR